MAKLHWVAELRDARSLSVRGGVGWAGSLELQIHSDCMRTMTARTADGY